MAEYMFQGIEHLPQLQLFACRSNWEWQNLGRDCLLYRQALQAIAPGKILKTEQNWGAAAEEILEAPVRMARRARQLAARAAVFVPPRLRRLVTRASGSLSPGALARRTREVRTRASSCSS